MCTCKVLALIGGAIVIGLCLAVALFLAWPTSAGVLLGMLELAAASATGGYIAAIVTRKGEPS